MGDANIMVRMNVGSLMELDALVGKHLTGEQPKRHWEDSYAHLHCESFEEACEALRDPYFQQFTPEERRPDTILHEVEIFPPYSTSIDAAWEVVESLGSSVEVLKIRRDKGRWAAAFGDRPAALATTAALAICLAALRVRGIEVEIVPAEPGRCEAKQTGGIFMQPGAFVRSGG
jgi:hypothetical protein